MTRDCDLSEQRRWPSSGREKNVSGGAAAEAGSSAHEEKALSEGVTWGAEYLVELEVVQEVD